MADRIILKRQLSIFPLPGDGAIEFPEFLTAISKILNDADSEAELVEVRF